MKIPTDKETDCTRAALHFLGYLESPFDDSDLPTTSEDNVEDFWVYTKNGVSKNNTFQFQKYSEMKKLYPPYDIDYYKTR